MVYGFGGSEMCYMLCQPLFGQHCDSVQVLEDDNKDYGFIGFNNTTCHYHCESRPAVWPEEFEPLRVPLFWVAWTNLKAAAIFLLRENNC